VFADLAEFLAYFGMVVYSFSLLILVLMPSVMEKYEGAGVFSFLIMAFRTSIGDFGMEEYKYMKEEKEAIKKGEDGPIVYPM